MMKGVHIDQLARDHNIDKKEWRSLYKSKKFNELQTRLNRFNRDLLIEHVQKQQPDFTVAEDVDVFGVLRDVLTRDEVNLAELSKVRLYCLRCHASRINFFLFEHAPKLDLPAYLSRLKQYELLSMLLKRWEFKEVTSLHSRLFARTLNDACLDDTNDSRNNFIHTLITTGSGSSSHLLFDNPRSDVPDGYIHNYIRWLSVLRQTHSNTEWLHKICGTYIYLMIDHKRADKMRCLLSEITRQEVLSMEQLTELITSRGESFSGLSLFEHCLIYSNKETCSVILGVLKNEDVNKLLTQGADSWLLTKIALKDKRQDVVETVLEYAIDLTESEKEEFYSQLVTHSLSQNMILLLKELASGYIIPEGTDKARKQALVYYNVKGREYMGEEEAQALVDGLHSLDFQVQTKRDWKVDTLEQDLKEDIQRMKDNCSVLVVFVMAHGSAEEICDADMKPVKPGYVDDIINSVVSGIPEGIPKISIIDACRERKAEPGKWERFTHISSNVKQVKEPINPKDYCRFMTAAKDEVTWRNVMLPILIEEWKRGGEFTEIMNRVRRRMKYHQVPEYRSTLSEHEKTLDRKLYM